MTQVSTTGTPLTNLWKRSTTPARYHGCLNPELDAWPRRLSRRLLKTDRYPPALFRVLNSLPPNPAIVDVGCGTGRALQCVQRLRPDAVCHGVDLAPVDRLSDNPVSELAKEGRFFQADITADDNLPRGCFDLVYSVNVIEHVPDGVGFIQALARLAKPGGLIVVHTMNHRGVLVGFYDDPTHIRPYSAESLRRAAHMAGITPLAVRDERSWPILLFSPFYSLYCATTRKRPTTSHFWEHLLAVQVSLTARAAESRP